MNEGDRFQLGEGRIGRGLVSRSVAGAALGNESTAPTWTAGALPREHALWLRMWSYVVVAIADTGRVSVNVTDGDGLVGSAESDVGFLASTPRTRLLLGGEGGRGLSGKVDEVQLWAGARDGVARCSSAGRYDDGCV